MRGFLLSVLLLAAASDASASSLGFPGEHAASVGIYIKDLASGEVIAEENSTMALVPASIMKAVTTATAMRLLGPEYRFTTSARLTGLRTGSTWNGDLEIVSSADPTLESEQFEQNLGFCDSILTRLKRLGITHISGDIRVLAPLKDPGPSPLWEIEDVAWSYGAALFGLNWRDNIFRLWPATGRTKPHVPGLKVELRHSPEGNDLLRGVESNTLVVSGRDVNNRKWSVQSSMPDPQAVFEYELKERLSSAGISIGGHRESVSKDEATTLYTHRSPAASQVMRSLMVRSDNMMADGMLRAIDPTGSRKDAVKKECALWDSLGVSMRYAAVCDGSGLSVVNRIAPATMGAILEKMVRSEYADDYVALFPRAGRDGTMRGFMANTELNGRLALKTGSVSAVQCYAGYLLDQDERPTHVVVIMVNAFYCPRAKLRESISNFLLQTLISKPES